MMKIDEKYRNIANWVADACVEIGFCDEYTGVTARAVDMGGVVWETEETFSTLEAALDALETGIAAWCKEHGIVWE
ncbi:MAG: hypothetical protein M9941_16055 [Anaerolineae bacterium]|nr:hypothetical protein [Anaerolineae bacterium]MCO5186676.1 hypothetical protein [Anaerolineae bacterium]MCO5194428.1 hypothetical protein [Anaerolineae bacterium]MCO5199260.1 hypothetical protein [Anaerolineae bacterium]